MTKLVTSIAVMMLRDEAGIDLDAPFVNYQPAFEQPEVLESFDLSSGAYTTRPAKRAITVRQLLTHTSGFGYWFIHDELRRLMPDEPEHFTAPFLMHEPGTRFAYGISTDVLGQVIKPLSGLSLERFFEQRIFTPLGLTDTGFTVPLDGSRLTTLHRRRNGSFIDGPNEVIGEPPRGGGGLYSTAADYLTLLRVLLNQGRYQDTVLLDPSTLRELLCNQIGELTAEAQTTAVAERAQDFIFMDGTQKFGLGVMLETRDQPTGRAAGSYSWAGIFNTYFWVDP